MSNPDRWLKNVSQADVLRIAREKQERELTLVQSGTVPENTTLPKSETVTDSETVSQSVSVMESTRVPDSETLSQLEAEPLQNKTVPDYKPLRKTKGFQRIPNELIFDVLPNLKPSVGAVLFRLYVHTWGFNSPTVTMSIPKLATLTGQKRTATLEAIKELELKGYIRRLGEDGRNPNKPLRGTIFEMIIEGPNPSEKRNPSEKQTPLKSETNIINSVNINNKREVANAKNCPDCNGTGFTYPEGFERGAKKCSHPKLMS